MFNNVEYIKYRDKIKSNEKYSVDKKVNYLNRLEVLKECNSLIILNSFHFSNLVGIKWKLLKKIINNTDDFYYNFEISKKSGGKRKINVPSKPLALCQKFIKEEILDNIKIHNASHGFSFNRSIISNAKMHLNREIVLNIDLKDFFPSISRKKVFYVFNVLCGYDNDLSHCLTKLVMYNDGLPQGACTSPILSNIVSYKMDLRLQKLAQKLNIVYTRYADDITFSGSRNVINDKFLHVVTGIVNECGYLINDKKTRFQTQYGKQEVTGLLVNNEKVSVPNHYLKRIRQELYYIDKFGLKEHKKNCNIYNKYYKEHLKGKIMFVYSIDKEKAVKLLEKYNSIFESDK